jgi:hypothetical protein
MGFLTVSAFARGKNPANIREFPPSPGRKGLPNWLIWSDDSVIAGGMKQRGRGCAIGFWNPLQLLHVMKIEVHIALLFTPQA